MASLTNDLRNLYEETLKLFASERYDTVDRLPLCHNFDIAIFRDEMWASRNPYNRGCFKNFASRLFPGKDSNMLVNSDLKMKWVLMRLDLVVIVGIME